MREWSVTMLGKRAVRTVLALVFLGGCVSAPTDSAVQETETTPVLRGVEISMDSQAVGGESTIALLGIERSAEATFRMDDARTAVLEFGGLVGGHFVQPVVPEGSLVDRVSVGYHDGQGGQSSPMVRVEFGLKVPAEFKIDEASKAFAFRVVPLVDELRENPVVIDEPVEEAGQLASGSESAPQPEIALAPPAPDATKVLGFSIEIVEGGVVAHLTADGSIRAAESFVIENPTRLVIDLPNMTSSMNDSKRPIDSPLVTQARLGKHSDKLRIVFDGKGGTEVFDGRWIVPTRDGLLVTIGSGEAIQAAIDSATKPLYVAATSDEVEDVTAEANNDGSHPEVSEASSEKTASQWAQVSRVEFMSEPTRDRILIASDRVLDVKRVDADAETVIFRLNHAQLEDGAAVRITTKDSGSVSSVTSFQQPEMASPEARVVVKRMAGEEGVISRDGTNVWIDFAHPEKVASTSPDKTGREDEVPAQAMSEGSAETPDSIVTSDVEEAKEASVTASEASAAPDKALASASKEVTSAPVPAAMDSADAGSEILEEGGYHEEKIYTGEHISLDFNDAEMGNILRLIAEVSGLNVIAGDEVKGKITIRLRDVPWDQALDVVLMTKGLGFARMGDVLRIAPIEVLRQEEEARLQERRSKEKLEDLVMRLVPVNYAGVDEAQKLVAKTLSARGSVMVDKRTNTLIIKDIVATVDEAEALVKSIDTQTPQVLIESKIVEANDDFERALGTRWNASKNPAPPGDPDRTAGITWTDGYSGTTGEDLVDRTNKAIVNNPINIDPTGVLSLGAWVLGDHFDINVEIQAAENNSLVKVISSPRVVTMDNRTAKIEQGLSIPFQSYEDNTVKTEFVDAVLSLEVTPHITADRSVIMNVLVTKDAPGATYGRSESPSIHKNHVETESLVKDGQTLVLGGVYQIDDTESGTRVPFFHTIPIMGNMFKSNDTRKKRNELLIFISPSILDVNEIAAR